MPESETEEPKGFSYYVDDETIRRFRQLTPLQRLRTLEAAQRFIEQAASPRVKELHRKFREGSI